jgi:predicted SAM-dependent methyltransferase
MFRTRQPVRLHIGCGGVHLDGWVNVDERPQPGVDVVADVTKGLDFRDVEAVYAEHFLEHLTPEAALSFLCAVRRALRPEGWLRLSTPNLDWVWSTHYRLDGDDETSRQGALALNRAFHAWGHRFLWNRAMLSEALEACGFEALRYCRYGESLLAHFHGIERHETWTDSAELPHVLIVEARPGAEQPERLKALHDRLRRDLVDHMLA